MSQRTGLEIAIIGMAGRFPRARDLAELWRRLHDGEDCIESFSDQDLLEAGVDESELRNPERVKAGGRLADPEYFDARFFDVNPRDAQLIDPQHRILLECAWEALESAGYDPAQLEGAPIGVYAGCGSNNYFVQNILANPDFVAAIGGFPSGFGVDKDHLAPMVAYKLGLEGPSVTVQTACSTALVSAHLASQALLNGECDLALAGGVTVNFLLRTGYTARDDGFYSRTGHTYTFDARADGTVPSSGAGVVVLKRLDDALADGDTILAVIKGSAINNDGPQRPGYTAPRVDGQAKAVRAALLLAEVEPDTIGFVETHGSATSLGDPIEVSALTKAFRAGTDRRGFCALGSIKSNIGHAGAAAGAAGLIKTVLALHHRQIPPTVHFERPNPQIRFEESPFFVNTEVIDWPAGDAPRRAGVTSLGLGGANAHLVLEEAPEPEPSSPSRPVQLLIWSAKTETAREAITDRLRDHLSDHPDASLADAAYTLKVGRRSFPYRRMLVCRRAADAIEALESRDPRRLLESVEETAERPFVFLFPGLGDHYAGMGRDLYRDEPVFREAIDTCAGLLAPELGLDIRREIHPPTQGAAGPASGGLDLRRMLGRGGAGPSGGALDSTRLSQPALFAVEYALAKLWMDWGVRPQAMLGYSLGEYVAACVAGVFSLEDTLRLVARRAQMIEETTPGAMLAVPLPASEAVSRMGPDLSLAAVNGPQISVVAGPVAAVEELERRLNEEGHVCRRLGTRHAFHSSMMEPLAARLTEIVRGIELHPPQIPYLSNVTGTWITAEEATDPGYWARHLCRPVLFAAGLDELLTDPARCYLELGPGQSLSSLALQHPSIGPGAVVLPCMRHAYDGSDDLELLLTALGKLWLAGARLDWRAFYAGESRRRVPLPTYPFERQRYCVEPKRRPGWAYGGAREAVAEEGTVSAEGRRAAAEEGAVSILHPRPALRNPYVAPRSETDRIIAGIWQDVLGIGPIGIYDNFFELGGHSLGGTQLMSRLGKRFGTELPLRALFEAPTVADLAEQIRERTAATGPQRPDLVRVPRDPELPLSFGQERLWFLEQLAPGGSAYNLPAAIGVRGELDIPALAASLREIVRRHEVLRTTFANLGGRPVPEIAPEASLGLPVVDLESLPEAVRATETERLAGEQARRPFDLVRGPLLRVTLLRTAPAEHVSLFTMHHIVSDGWSMGVLIRELVALYAACTGGRLSPLPELPIQYADFASWQKRWLAGETLASELDFWRERLAGAPRTLDLPTDRPRPPIQTYRGGRIFFRLPERLVSGLKALARERETTPFVVLLSAFQVLLAHESGQRDIVVGSPIAGRARLETEDLIGLFVNMLALRTRLEGDPEVAELLDQVQEATLAAHAHQDLPFEKLVEELQPERNLRRSPIFQVVFVLENTPRTEMAIPGLTFERLPVQSQGARFDLTATVAEEGDGMAGNFEYNSDLFEAASVQRMIDRFERLLDAMVASPRARVSELLPAQAGKEDPQAAVERLPGARELREFLKARLPEYMIPSTFVFLESFPLTSSGKRDLRALPAPEEAVRDDEEQSLIIAARTPAEEILAGIVAQLLKIDRVGVDDNFFELGGHSLVVTQLISRIRDAFGVELPVPSVFLAPTVAGLAAVIEQEAWGSPQLVPPPIEPMPRGETLPLSFAQQRLWFLDQLQPGDPVYNIPGAVRLRGRLDLPALLASLGEIVRRHESLRTTFPSVRGEAMQRIAPHLPLPCTVVDLEGLPAAAREEESRRLLRDLPEVPFDLSRGPLFRVTLTRTAADDHVMLVTMHHVVTDGWSWGVLIRELGGLYPALLAGTPSPLTELRVQYADFAKWQRQWLTGEVLERELRYWRERLAEPRPSLELPLDRPRPPLRSSRGTEHSFLLSRELSTRLLSLSRAEGATLYMTLLAVFQHLLGRYSGQSDIPVGTQIAGRKHLQTEDLIGFFVNTLVMRSDVSGDPPFTMLLGRVREVSLGAFAHQELPFEKLVEDLQPPRDPSRMPLAEVLFTLQNAPMEPLTLPGLAIEPLSHKGTRVSFDLVLTLQEAAEGLRGWLDFNRDLFERATIERMHRHFEALLGSVVEDPTRPLSTLPLFSESEERELQEARSRSAALPEVVARQGESEEPRSTAPLTPAGKALAILWSELLGVSEIGPADDFFALGGHSLLAVRLRARIEEELGVSLPLALLFLEPVLERQARLLPQDMEDDEPRIGSRPVAVGYS